MQLLLRLLSCLEGGAGVELVCDRSIKIAVSAKSIKWNGPLSFSHGDKQSWNGNAVSAPDGTTSNDGLSLTSASTGASSVP